MDIFESYKRDYGYNLRRDTSTQCIVSDETRALQSLRQQGSNNANYNHKWTDEQKTNMSSIKIEQHVSGNIYGDEWKQKISAASTELWKDETKRANMAKKVSKSKEKYRFYQYTKDMTHVQTWESVKDIILAYPSFKWQNIYAVCNGYKPSYKSFIWTKDVKI